jgi:hypothetical protein
MLTCVAHVNRLGAQTARVEGIVWLALDQELGGTDFIAGASQLAPGFAVDFGDAAARGSLRKEVELRVMFSYRYGDYIPEIFGDNINREEIDFAGSVAAIIAPALNRVVRVDKTHGGFDLNAPEFFAGVGYEVVALAVSPDTSDAKAEAGGFGEERGLGGFAMRLTRGEADGMEFGNDG